MKNDIPTSKAEISNVVGTAKISEKLDLGKIDTYLANTTYEPEQFSGVSYRSAEPPGTVNIFNSGKIVCTGAKDRGSVKKIISGLLEKLRYLDIRVYEHPEVEIKNVVSTFTLDRPLNLSKIAISFGLKNVDYEPSSFPGLVYRIKDPKVTFILFGSGKIISTGAGSAAEAETAFRILNRKLDRHGIIG